MAGAAWGVLFVSQEAYDYATTSPRFEVRSLVFEPTEHLDDSDLRKILALEPGTNILAVEPELMAEKIAAQPWVREAIVQRHMPDTLEVRVVEREAKAMVLADNFYLVDPQGRPFKRADGDEERGLPIVTGIDRASFLKDDIAAQAQLARALDVIALYEQKARPRLGEVHLEAEGGLSLYTAERGTRLRVGRAPIERALSRYDALRAALGSRADDLEVVHLDGEVRVDAPERVVARFIDPLVEQSLLAEAAAQRAPQADADSASAAPAQPDAAPKKHRIPRYD